MMVPSTLDEKATQILAKSLFKELRMNGYSPNQILGLSTELIDLVTKELRGAHHATSRPLSSANDEAGVAASA